MPDRFWLKLKNQTNFGLFWTGEILLPKNYTNIWYFLVIFGKNNEFDLFLKLASLQNSSQFDALYDFFPQI